jgi:hypothetical protein
VTIRWSISVVHWLFESTSVSEHINRWSSWRLLIGSVSSVIRRWGLEVAWGWTRGVMLAPRWVSRIGGTLNVTLGTVVVPLVVRRVWVRSLTGSLMIWRVVWSLTLRGTVIVLTWSRVKVGGLVRIVDILKLVCLNNMLVQTALRLTN